ncbi:hypothetical protein E4U42_008038 [Claviceps africana]|uniref:Polynucleotide 5'-hydroxyl-kinase GRC3 n=1 Tax=Claviceps africana TaxID=83212 RepID=A0A8K0JCW2_9HYPO|nr:hypothetical protein E4U42_008038 [Claviceps africana]
MSSSKRRKLEGEPPPPSPVSAVSAIAARRRLGASAVPTQRSSPEPVTPSTNSFSALQSLKPKKSKDGTRSPRKGAKQSLLQRNEASRPGASPAPQGTSRASDTAPIATKTSVASPQPPNISYSSFQIPQIKHQAMADGSLEVSLDEGERFIVLGCFGIRVLTGEITIAGATLRESETIFWVYAPHCSAVPVIRTTQDCRILFHNDPNSVHLKKLGRLSPLFKRLWDEPAEANDNAGKRSFRFIGTSSDVPKRCVIQELVSPPEWNKLLGSIAPTTSSGNQYSGFICGPKSAGKSTIARLLTNRLLTACHGDSRAVIVLDLDPGQPEFTPPGTVSLIRVSRPNLGVPFSHTSFGDPGNTVLRCHALASVTPASSPDLFIACATDMYEFYQRFHRKSPLIINTPGWILGTGLDLLVALITRMRPAQVIYMSEEGPADVVETLEETTKHEFSTLPSQPSDFMSRTSAHFRSMQMMSYFHSQILPGCQTAKTSSIRWLAQPISHTRPYVVQYQGKNQGILGILSYDCQTPPHLLAASINGAILAIVEIEEPTAFREVRDTRSDVDVGTGTGTGVDICRTPEGLPLIVNATDGTLDPRYCRTIGLALIRGVDAHNKSLQVMTPLALSALEQVQSQGRSIVLVHGNFDSPHWAYTEDLYEQTNQDDDAMERDLDMSDGDSSEDDGGAVDGGTAQGAYAGRVSTVPWIETLRANQKRPVGSRVWRVRRDLGRNTGD